MLNDELGMWNDRRSSILLYLYLLLVYTALPVVPILSHRVSDQTMH